jgi:opacity protein-like surface antigen
MHAADHQRVYRWHSIVAGGVAMHLFRIVFLCPALLSGALIFACLLPTQAVAQKTAKDFKLQITPFVGYRLGGTFEDDDTEEDYDLDNNSSAGLIINFPSKANTEWEIYYSKQSTELKTGDLFLGTRVVDMDVEYLHLGGTYLFDRSGESQPYFVATIGATRMEPSGVDTSSETFFSFAAGGGYKYFPDKHIGLRLDGRFIGTFIDSNSNIFCQSDQGGTCVINTTGKILYQFEMQAGVVFRF